MSHAAPWSIKGIDPRTRDAAREAARRAGMSVGEWLDQMIREGAMPEAHGDLEHDGADSLDSIADRLDRLSRGKTEAAIVSPARPEMSRSEVSALVQEASSRQSRAQQQKTAGALDAIARWMEATDQRLQAAQRAAADQNERTASLVAEAVRTMSERLGDMERRAPASHSLAAQSPAYAAPAYEPAPAAEPARRPALSRDTLSAAIVDIRTRQRDLEGGSAAAQPRSQAGATLHHLKDELRTLSQTVGALAQPQPQGFVERRATVHQPQVEGALRDILAKLGEIKSPQSLDGLTRALARIETEVGRLAERKPDGAEQHLLRAIEKLDDKIDRLASASDLLPFADAARDLGDLKSLMRQGSGIERELGAQLSLLSGELARMREFAAQGPDMADLRAAVEDVRASLKRERPGDNDIARQIESLARRLDDVQTGVSGAELQERLEALAARIQLNAAKGNTTDPTLERRLEALLIRMEDAAGRETGLGPQIEHRLQGLQDRIDQIGNHGTSRIESQLDALSARLEQLAASSTLAAVSTGKGTVVAMPNMKPIEDMLRGLQSRFDEAQRPDATPESFQALERQVARLAERLDQQNGGASAGLERSLQDLVGSVTALRNEATLGAEKAAERVMSTHLDGLRSQVAALPDRTQDAFNAVHGSLEKIVARLSQLELDMMPDRSEEPVGSRFPVRAEPDAPVIERGMPPAFEAPAIPVPTARAMPAVAAPAPAIAAPPVSAPAARGRAAAPSPGGDVLDMPLEPGSGRPRPSAQPAQDGAEPTSGDPAVKASFIAAARRAAQAAQDAHAQDAAQANPSKAGSLLSRFKLGGGKDKTKDKAAPAAAAMPPEAKARTETAKADIAKSDTSKTDATKPASSKRKPVLLLSLAALVLAVGAMHVLTPQADAPTAPAQPQLQSQPRTEPVPDLPRNQQGAIRDLTPAAPQGVDGNSATASLQAAPPASPPSAGETAASLLAPSPAQAAAPVVPSLAVPMAPVTPAESSITVSNLPELPATGLPAGLRKAAMSGNAAAVYDLASRLSDGRGVARDPKLALRLFERAAAAGVVPAQFRLGNMHEKAIGTARDVALARQWYERAASKGNAKAMHNLAVLYAEGASGRPDYSEAVTWFTRAAEHGVRDSQFNLGVLQARGLGTAQDLVASYTWFAVAAKQGDEDAAKKRDEVAAQLGNSDLTLAKAAAEQWRPKVADPSANDVTLPAQGWEDTPQATKKPPAKSNKTS